MSRAPTSPGLAAPGCGQRGSDQLAFNRFLAAEAMSWLDEQLGAAGIERSGDVEQPQLRPWATVLRATTTQGPVWLKAARPGTTLEVGIHELLARVAPGWVLTPIATDPARGWMVLPDGGSPLGERLSGADMPEALVTALVRYGEL